MDDLDDITSRLFKSGIFLFIGSILGTLGTFLARTVSARFLTTDGYGALALGLSIVTASSTIVLLGLDQGMGRYLPRNEDQSVQRRFMLAAFSTSIPIALLAGGLLVGFGPTIGEVFFNDSLAGLVFRLFGLAIPCIVTMKLCIGGIQGLEQSLPKTLIQDLILPISRLGVLAVIVYIGLGVFATTMAFVFSFFAGAAAGLYFLLKYGPISDISDVRLQGLNWERSELLAFSIPLTVSGIMSIVFSNIDTIMVGYFLTMSEVGIYDVTYLLSHFIVIILSSFLFLFMPIFSRLDSEKRTNEMKDVYILLTKWVFIISLPIFLIYLHFPKVLITITFGEKYASGSIALVVLSFGFFTNVMTGPNGNALLALGKTRFIMLINVVVAVVNFWLNLTLIPEYSIFGAAIATSVSYALLNTLSSLKLYSDTGIHPVSPSSVKLAAGSVTTLIVAYNLIPHFSHRKYVWFAAVILVFLITYPILVLALVNFTEEELAMVEQIERWAEIDLRHMRQFMK